MDMSVDNAGVGTAKVSATAAVRLRDEEHMPFPFPLLGKKRAAFRLMPRRAGCIVLDQESGDIFASARVAPRAREQREDDLCFERSRKSKQG